MSTVISTIVGVFTGSLVTWLTARHYYRQAARDLKEEADRFAKVIDETFLSLERSGWFRVTRDDSGRIIGVAPTLRLGSPPRDDRA